MSNPFLSRAHVRAALQSLGLHPTRGMGQNFLVDGDVLAQIVAAAELNAADTVLEIGPGLGVLTWDLLRAAGRVVAVELDKRLAARLHETFAAEPRLTIVQGDILNLAPGDLLGQAEQETSSVAQRSQSPVSSPPVAQSPSANHESPPYKVVANLPYAITSPVLRHLLEAARPPALITVLVQWEVAERIVAQPGDLSILAHSVQIYAEPEIIAKVPPGSFLPPPAVSSAILRLRVRPRPAVAVDSVAALLRVVKAGFLQGRKKLSNALPSGLAALGARIPKEDAIAALVAAGISPDRRAETVTLAEWAALYRVLYPKADDAGPTMDNEPPDSRVC